ncbi:hypothetical protein Vretimale_6240 [Volvox reticuliferus]|uniref:Uncharacterized protein n=1 Tax=Volvox reticuliferus TaxID=1737510 RepID=A0A8J4LKB2_9CHLO|nr:hypothetical protein Vretifemale_8047 [Volvox reticuliferus]GIM01419.1 hypothetical protein Vretimale_6240 [Volvox reticuliferus]
MEDAIVAAAGAIAGEMATKTNGRRRRRDNDAGPGEVAGKSLTRGFGSGNNANAGGRAPRRERRTVGGKAPARDGAGDPSTARKLKEDRQDEGLQAEEKEEGQEKVGEGSLRHKRRRRGGGADLTAMAGPSSALVFGYEGVKAVLRDEAGPVGPGASGGPVTGATGRQRGRGLRGRGRGRGRGQGRRSNGGHNSEGMEEAADGLVAAAAAEEAGAVTTQGRGARGRGRSRRGRNSLGGQTLAGRGQGRGRGRGSNVNPSDRVLRSTPARTPNAGGNAGEEGEDDDEDMVTAEEDAEEAAEEGEAGRPEPESDRRKVGDSAWQALMQLQSLHGLPGQGVGGARTPLGHQSGTTASGSGINPEDLLMAWQRHHNLVEATGRMLSHVLDLVVAMGPQKTGSQGRGPGRDSPGREGIDMGRGRDGRGRGRGGKRGGRGGRGSGRVGRG